MQQIAPNVYVQTTSPPLTVGALLTDEGWVVIDTLPMPQHAQQWLAALREISAKPFLYVINTDQHRDRILGNARFGAPVIAQQAAAQHMLALKNAFVSQAAEEMSRNDNELVALASLQLALPELSFAEAMGLFCGGHELSLLHRPGASYGGAWVVLTAERVLFAGDSLTDHRHPLITEGNTNAWIATLDELRGEAYQGWVLVPGRGQPTDSSAAAALADYLRAARQRVAGLIRAGRPRSEVASLLTDMLGVFAFEPDERDDVQRRIKSGLEIIYDELRAPGGLDGETPDETA